MEDIETLFICPKCGYAANLEDAGEIHLCQICKSVLNKTEERKTIGEWILLILDINNNLKPTPEYTALLAALREQYCLHSPQFDQAAWDRRVRIELGKEKLPETPKPKPIPKCPTCQSTDIEQISTTKRVGSILMWGLASKNVGKTMHCRNCGYRW